MRTVREIFGGLVKSMKDRGAKAIELLLTSSDILRYISELQSSISRGGGIARGHHRLYQPFGEQCSKQRERKIEADFDPLPDLMSQGLLS